MPKIVATRAVEWLGEFGATRREDPFFLAVGFWLPEHDELHVPGSRSRVLWEEDGVWYWEGEAIDFDELIR